MAQASKWTFQKNIVLYAGQKTVPTQNFVPTANISLTHRQATGSTGLVLAGLKTKPMQTFAHIVAKQEHRQSSGGRV